MTHTPDMHTNVESQSARVLHSTQTLEVELHTRPGHSRDDVQGIALAHAPAMQTVSSAQSAAREQGVVDGPLHPPVAATHPIASPIVHFLIRGIVRCLRGR